MPGPSTLFREDVFAGGYGGLQVHRPEARRRSEHDVVRPAVDHLLVTIQAGETALFRKVHLITQLLDLIFFG